jgi:hypothetical protein
MDLGDPVRIEAQAVRQLGLVEKLLEASRRRRALGALNFGKQATLHFRFFSCR